MNWFSKVKREFSRAARPFAGQPILYVEIGCFEGDSAEWVCRNILDHPNARGIGIDDYAPDRKRDQTAIDAIKAATMERLAEFTRAGKWGWRFDKSQEALRGWWESPIDLLYIDGSHFSHDVLTDFVLAFPHLREGSVVIFDDFGIGHRQFRNDGLPRVPIAVAAILSAFRLFVEPIDTGGPMQAAVRVIRKPVVGELLGRKRG